MKKLLYLALFLMSFQVSAQFNLLDTIKKSTDVIQSITQGNNQSNQAIPEQKNQTNSGATKRVQGPPIAKSGTSVTNKNIKNILEKFEKQYPGIRWKSQDELNVLVSVEIIKNGSDKFYKFRITNPDQVPNGYSMVSFDCAIPRHFEQAIETLKAAPKTIILTAVDWSLGAPDTESGIARRKPEFKLDAICDFVLVGN